jgi:TetR/AcrR family transcriptional regulator
MTVVGRRERLPAAERRQAVLDVACQVFTGSSYRCATTAEIAHRAGVSEPILYRHFPSKRHLYLACLDEAWERLQAVGAAALGRRPDPAPPIGAVVECYMRSEERVRLVDLWIQGLAEAGDDPVIAAAVRDQIREVHQWFADQIVDSQEQGLIEQDRDPVAEAWIVIATGLLVTIDSRLGGFLAGDMARVKRERRRWMTGQADDVQEAPSARARP